MKLWTMRLISALFAVVMLTGCNTLEGFGEDVETAGDEIDEEL